MNNIFEVKNKATNTLIKVKFEKLTSLNLDEAVTIQKKVVDYLNIKELYASTSKEEFLAYLEMPCTILGVKTLDCNELIALGVYINKGLDNHNYGYDLDYNRDDLLKTGQIESTIVLPDFRGNKLQEKICIELEKISRAQGDKYLTATVSPINPYSLNTFLNLGFENIKEKLKYGGLRRCILSKKL